MVKVLTLIGGLVVVCIVIIVLYAIVLFCEYLAHEVVKKYKIKHRFDKPPTAKCYCRDCKYWNCRSWHCRKYEGYSMAAAWFCCLAEPLNATELQKRDAEEAEYIERLKKITNVNRTGGLHGTDI